MKFPAHGKIQIVQEGRVLIAEHTGPFNVEYWQESASVVRLALERMALDAPFGYLVEFRESAISSVEAVDLIIERNRGFLDRYYQCVGMAVAAEPTIEGRETMTLYIHRFFGVLGGAPGSTGLFASRAHAINFLQQRLRLVEAANKPIR